MGRVYKDYRLGVGEGLGLMVKLGAGGSERVYDYGYIGL